MNKRIVSLAVFLGLLAGCTPPSTSLSSANSTNTNSQTTSSSVTPTSSSSTTTTTSSTAPTSSSASSTSSSSASASSISSSSSVSSSETQPITPILATIKGSYANLVVYTFVKSGSNRVYIVRLSNPRVAPNPPVSVIKIVITNTSSILFEKDLIPSPADSSSPSFSDAILFDDNNLLISYFLGSTGVYMISTFNLTTRLENNLGNVRVNIIPDANASRTLLKDKKFLLTGTIGTDHGIFKLNNDLTTTFLRAVPQAFSNNLSFKVSPNYNFPLIYGSSDNGSIGMNYVHPTKTYDIILKTSDFSFVLEGEKDNQSFSVGTRLNVNFFTNAIVVRKLTRAMNPDNDSSVIITNTLYVYNMEGLEKVNQEYTNDLTAFSTTTDLYSTVAGSNNLFVSASITGFTFGRRANNSNSSFDFFMYNDVLNQTRTFTVTNTTIDFIQLDQLGNVYVLTDTTSPNTFTVYSVNGTDYPYMPDSKFESFNFKYFIKDSNSYNLPISRTKNPFLLEFLNDGSVNVIHFLNNQYRVLNATNFGDFSTIYHVSTSLFANNIQYVSVTGYSDSANALIFRSLIINFTANTLIAVTRTYSVNSNTQDNYTYSNGYVVDSVTNRQNSTTTTIGLEFINLATGEFTYVAFTTPIVNYVYVRNFTLNNNGTFLISYSGSSSGTITGSTSDLTTLNVTPSSGGGTYTYIGRFENVLNDLDFVFSDTETPGTENTPPSYVMAFYVGTNFNGQVSSLTQVVGAGIPTSSAPFQIVIFDEPGTANDKLFLYFFFSNTLVDLTQEGFPVLKGYLTTTGFTLIDSNFNETDDYLTSTKITMINPFTF